MNYNCRFNLEYDDANYMLKRNMALTDLLSAAGASINVVRMMVRRADGALLDNTSETISADEYARLTDPEDSYYREIMESVTITFKWVDSIGLLPASVITTDNSEIVKGRRPAVIVASIFHLEVDPDVYSKEKVEAAYDRLSSVEATRLNHLKELLVADGVCIRQYTMADVDGMIKATVDFSPMEIKDYIRYVFPYNAIRDNGLLFIVWTGTEAGWLPTFTGRSKDDERGFCICLPEDVSDDDEDEEDDYEYEEGFGAYSEPDYCFSSEEKPVSTEEMSTVSLIERSKNYGTYERRAH